MPLGQAGPTPPTAAATRAPPMHATRDTRHGTHHTRTTTKNSRTKAPRSTNTSVSGRMLLSSEFQLTKNSHQSQSDTYVCCSEASLMPTIRNTHPYCYRRNWIEFGFDWLQPKSIWINLDQFDLVQNLLYLEINLAKSVPGPILSPESPSSSETVNVT